ncbi:MAG: bifunctional UDP-N-acetylmuramoyl-tripeptide:D-alanyl-D-alanine ligase/alanine racemase [Bacteroidota bacterium]
MQQIATLTGGELLGPTNGTYLIKHLAFDSRKLDRTEHTLFLAIEGEVHDGHQYLGDCYRKGIRTFLVSRSVHPGDYPEAHFIRVNHALEALQTLATAKRARLKVPIWAITGSNGKTIVKEWLFQLLQKDRQIGRSPKSYNSQLGVPLSLWSLPDTMELGIIEAGISRAGEMERLADMIRPNWGLLTNIGQAHDAGFSSRKGKLLEKMKLFTSCKTIFYGSDQPLVKAAIQEHFADRECLSWGYDTEADLQIMAVQYKAPQTTIKAVYQGESLTMHLPLSDEASFKNACLCWLVMIRLGYSHAEIQDRVANLEAIGMRLEMREAIQGCTLINDAYNNDLTGLTIALHFLRAQTTQEHKTLILSDIPQSDQKPQELYRDVARLLSPNNITRLIGIGQSIEWIKQYIPEETQAHFYPDTQSFLAHFPFSSLQNEAILLKGARAFTFERIATRLAKQNHSTQLEINLNALAHNVRVYQEKLPKGTKLMAMVKAAGYGSGALEVASLLDFCQVDYLGVAYVDEGVTLRKSGIDRPIMVLNVSPNSFDALIRHKLEPEIYSLNQLRQLISHLRYYPEQRVSIHLKIETGMHRLGFVETEISTLLDLLRQSSQVQVASAFSHLAASETATEDAYTHRQAQIFLEQHQRLVKGLNRIQIPRHLVNSSGIIRFPEYHFEMVRLGIGLYGIDGSQEVQSNLETVFRFKTTISQIKEVRAGDTVGYSRMGRVQENGRIATIAVGYADGLARRLGNGQGSVWIRGQRAPIIGNVCMDMCMVDVGHIRSVHPGDEVEIFGSNISVQEFAEHMGTIPYEVFTSISARVPRVYVQE